MRRMHDRPVLLAVAALGILALTGCAPTAAPTATTTAAAVPAATAPTPVDEPTVTAAPAPSSTPGGCPSNGAARPGDAESAIDGDLDGDGRHDTVLYSPGSDLFGIVTASGAVLTVRDPLAGPGRHTGWATRIAGGAVVMVLADGRGADLYSLQRSGGMCTIGPVLNAQGDQYRFDQEDLRGHGTGVGCRPQEGALQLGGYDARPVQGDPDRLRVTFTRVTVSGDGRTATNGATSVVAESAASGSATVRIARGSTCGSAPIVGSNGQ
jgi:hypothetical protein